MTIRASHRPSEDRQYRAPDGMSPVLDPTRLGHPLDCGALLTCPRERSFVGRGTIAVQEPGRSEYSGPGAHRRDDFGLSRPVAEPRLERTVLDKLAGADASGDHNDVAARRLGMGVIGEGLRALRAPHRACVGPGKADLKMIGEHPEHLERAEHVQQLETIEEDDCDLKGLGHEQILSSPRRSGHRILIDRVGGP